MIPEANWIESVAKILSSGGGEVKLTLGEEKTSINLSHEEEPETVELILEPDGTLEIRLDESYKQCLSREDFMDNLCDSMDVHLGYAKRGELNLLGLLLELKERT